MLRRYVLAVVMSSTSAAFRLATLSLILAFTACEKGDTEIKVYRLVKAREASYS